MFPHCRKLRDWRQRLEREGATDTLLLAVYYTTLSAATWKVESDLVYQIYCLETIRSNLAFEIITLTLDKVTDYFTKAKGRMAGKAQVENQLRKNANTESGQQTREVSVPEADFRIDSSQKLAESNTSAPISQTGSGKSKHMQSTGKRKKELSNDLACCQRQSLSYL